jgi:nitrite reductase/ring-hydroxylating ferredoxin subunit/uncharacterized membrane protein
MDHPVTYGRLRAVARPDHHTAPGPSSKARARRSWMLAEAATRAVEEAGPLDALGKKAISLVGRILRAGRLKDLLSGTWLGHPLHPALTDVPIGAWISAAALDAVGDERAERAADTLVGFGILSALPTAVTGLSDLADVVKRRDRSVGAAHALINVLGLSLYTASYLARKDGRRAMGVALSTAGVAAITAGGFLGGHLAYRRGIGVDHTVFETAPREWTPVLAIGDLPPATPRRVRADGVDVLLYRDGDHIRALGARCSHRGGPLHKGEFRQGTVTCPWHLSTFRLEDGAVAAGPATAPQPSYEARIIDGTIEVRTGEPA